MLCILLLVLSLSELSNANNNETDLLYVNTIYGTILGYSDDYANIWSSIPFAAPPIGDLRFTPPQPTKWEGVLNTMDDPPGCIQECGLCWWACPRIVEEDCLYLNVFAPRDASPTNLKSVMFFIHGGDFREGYSGGVLYNATKLVNMTDIVLVTTNYRLGVQGFFYDNITGLMGNYGFQDQIFALEWVYKNIEKFGGNKSDISIFGQSAGAISVALLLLNTNNTIIKAAIIESDPFGLPLRTTKTWGQLPNLFKTYAGCNPIRSASEQLKCLRDISANDLLAAQLKAGKEIAVEIKWFFELFMPWTPTVGVGIIPDQPLFGIQKEKYLRDVPIIAGVVKNEGALYIWGAFGTPLGKLEFEAFVTLLLGVQDAQAVLKYYSSYNVTNSSDYRPLLSEIATDALFRCPTRNISNVIALDKNHTALNYMYHFNHISSFNDHAFPDDTECWDRVCHASELAYVFEPDVSLDNASYTQNEWQLAQTVGYYWSSLAKNKIPGNGNPKRPVQWIPFGGGTKQNSIIFNIQNVNNGVRIESNYDLPVCNFWDTLSYNWLPN